MTEAMPPADLPTQAQLAWLVRSLGMRFNFKSKTHLALRSVDQSDQPERVQPREKVFSMLNRRLRARNIRNPLKHANLIRAGSASDQMKQADFHDNR